MSSDLVPTDGRFRRSCASSYTCPDSSHRRSPLHSIQSLMPRLSQSTKRPSQQHPRLETRENGEIQSLLAGEAVTAVSATNPTLRISRTSICIEVLAAYSSAVCIVRMRHADNEGLRALSTYQVFATHARRSSLMNRCRWVIAFTREGQAAARMLVPRSVAMP